MPTAMNKPPASANAKTPSATSQDGMLMTSEQHAKMAEVYARPDPDNPHLAQWRANLARSHAALARAARKREAQKANPSS